MADHDQSIDQIELAPSASEDAPTNSFEERASILYPDDKPQTDGEESEKGDGKPTDAAKAAAPEAYDIKAPEGLEIDTELLGEATPVFRELGLTNEGASKLMPLASKLIDRFQDQQQDAFDAVKTDWAREAKADPKIGGKNWAETERLMSVALKAGGAAPGSDFRNLMDESGLGNNPVVIRFIRQVGYALSQAPGSPHSDKRDRTQILYPND